MRPPSTTIDDRGLDRAFALARQSVESGALPAAVLAIVHADGPPRIEAFSGADRVAPDSIFPIASVTKAVLATSVMQLVQDGELSLFEPIRHYISEFRHESVTAWHLLTHTSGLAVDMDWAETLRRRPTAAELLDRACRARLSFPPGTQWRYNTLSFYVLAELLTRLGGLPYADFQRRRLFDPVGMPDTSYDPLAAGDRVALIDAMFDSGVSRAEMTRYQVSITPPGFGLWSTAADLIALGRTLLDDVAIGSGRILVPPYAELMTRTHTSDIPRFDAGHPRPVRYGLGWRKGTLDGYPTLPGSPRVFEHDGASGCQLWIDPEWDLVYVFVSNRYGIAGHPYVRPLQAAYGALRRS